MSAYAILDIEVIDPAQYEAYRKQAPATVTAYGGKYLARGGKTQVTEGTWQPRRLVILEFESVDRIMEWFNSPEYSAIKSLRQQSTHSNMVVVEGV